MSKRLTVFVLSLTMLLAAMACSPASKTTAPDSGSRPPTASPPMTPTVPAQQPAGQAGWLPQNGAGVQPISDQRMIVRTAEVSLIVRNVTEARDQISNLAANLSGFVVSSSVRGDGPDMRGSISIRVPDEHFDSTLVELRKLAIRVDTESTNSQDVTEQYTDLQARLKNAQATEAQYVTILGQAKTVDDTLKVYNALSQVRQQIEQLQGQIQYLERTALMSLINVQLRPQGTTAELVTPGWSPIEVLKSAIRAIISFGKVVVNILIWVIIFSPVWGAALLIYWLLRRKAKKDAAGTRQKEQYQYFPGK